MGLSAGERHYRSKPPSCVRRDFNRQQAYYKKNNIDNPQQDTGFASVIDFNTNDSFKGSSTPLVNNNSVQQTDLTRDMFTHEVATHSVNSCIQTDPTPLVSMGCQVNPCQKKRKTQTETDTRHFSVQTVCDKGSDISAQTEFQGEDKSSQMSPCILKHRAMVTDTLLFESCHTQTFQPKKDKGSQWKNLKPETSFNHSGVQTHSSGYMTSSECQTESKCVVSTSTNTVVKLLKTQTDWTNIHRRPRAQQQHPTSHGATASYRYSPGEAIEARMKAREAQYEKSRLLSKSHVGNVT